MAISLSSLKSTVEVSASRAPIVLVYGIDGIGKTSFAAEFPSPLYVPTAGERAPSDIDMATPGTIETIDDLWNVIGELMAGDHEFKTLIIDSMDGLEPIMNGVTCARIGAASIDDNSQGSPAAFGRGDVASDVEWAQFMDACDDLAEAGISVVLVAHPEIKRFDSPVTDPYDRYQVKLRKRAAALLRERSDIVAFMNTRVSLKSKTVAPKKDVTHAEGGKERQIHLTEAAGFMAKSRYPTPDTIVYKKGQGYAELAKYLPQGQEAPTE
ncbi:MULTISPECIES: ATP-binding protein [unclassified Mesorhizobium]|uniref:ATP-binding protein n=1 Tax=unclassified Mesorhizobium TaxID=325217 RepID=UPI001125EC32|nr:MULTISPECIES: ATP-binding protein [unclassified Mesorhizobium]TPJ86927.1 ATP-binding protein [Mesorhizobium sp. B2-5-12]TPK19150.1 ATP-binding protein [Mesorhizobium sp. B2-5-6]